MPKFEVGVVIKAIDNATASMKRVEASMKSMGSTAGQVSNSISNSFGRVNRAITGMQMNMAGSVARVKSSMAGLNNEIGLMTQRYAVLGAAGVGVFAAFIKPTAELEQLRFVMKKLYKDDTEKSTAAFEKLKKMAASSPQTFIQMADSMRMLKQFGIEPLGQDFDHIIGYLNTFVPDAERSSNAVLALGQAWSLGKLQMQDARQMVNAGIPVFDILPKILGKSASAVQGLMADGKIGRAEMKLFFDYMGKTAGESGAEIQGLFGTKISNLVDVWAIFADKVMNTDLGGTSVFQDIKDDIQSITDLLQNGFEGGSGLQVAESMMDIYHASKDVISGFIEVGMIVGSIIKGLSDSVGGFGNLLKIVLISIALPALAALFTPAGGFMLAVVAIGAALWAVAAAVVLVRDNWISWVNAGITGLNKLIDLADQVTGGLIKINKLQLLDDPVKAKRDEEKKQRLLNQQKAAVQDKQNNFDRKKGILDMGLSEGLDLSGAFKPLGVAPFQETASIPGAPNPGGLPFGPSWQPRLALATAQNPAQAKPKKDDLNIKLSVDAPFAMNVKGFNFLGDSNANFHADLGRVAL